MAKNTKKSILNAAKLLFAKHGYDGCNMDRIAEKAKINKATIYYHFKSKSKLYETVLEINLQRFLQRVREAVYPLNSPEKKLEAFIRTYAGNFSGDKQMAPLMLRELASDGAHLTDKTRTVLRDIIVEIDSILSDGERSDLFKNTKSFVPYFMIVGSMNIFTSTPSMRKKFKRSENDFGFSSTVDETAHEISNIILNGIRR